MGGNNTYHPISTLYLPIPIWVESNTRLLESDPPFPHISTYPLPDASLENRMWSDLTEDP